MELFYIVEITLKRLHIYITALNFFNDCSSPKRDPTKSVPVSWVAGRTTTTLLATTRKQKQHRSCPFVSCLCFTCWGVTVPAKVSLCGRLLQLHVSAMTATTTTQSSRMPITRPTRKTTLPLHFYLPILVAGGLDRQSVKMLRYDVILLL